MEKPNTTEKTNNEKPEKLVKPEAVKTEAEKIWNEIKEKSIEMFALPNQKVQKYCKVITIEPTKLYLIPSAASVLPALELALGDRYSVEVVDKYLAVSRNKNK
jgi:hypothetical protein